MKRYYFEPGAVQCYRKRGALARLRRALQLAMGLGKACLVGEPVDRLGRFVLDAAALLAFAVCVGTLAGWVDLALAMEGI